MDALCRHFLDFPEPVLLVGSEGKVLFLNHSAEDLLGLNLDQDEPIYCTDVLWVGINDTQCDLIKSCLASGGLKDVPVRVRSRRDGWLDRSATANLIKDGNGTVAGCLAFLREAPVPSQSESKLRTEVAILRSILKNFPTPFFTVDSDLTVTYMNEHLQELTGFSREEAVNKLHCSQILSTPYCNTPGCMLRQAMGTRLPVTGVRHTITNREGKIIPVVVYASIITDLDQNVIGGFEAIRDISQRFAAEQKIDFLIEMTQEGIVMVNEGYQVTYANSRMAEICKRPKEDLLGMDVREILPRELVELMSEIIVKADEKRQVRFCSTIRPDNDSHTDSPSFEICFASVRVSNEVLGCLYFRDLSSHIEVERELRKANSFLNNIIRSSVSGIVVIDTEGNVLIFNEGAERILGYKAEEVVGHPDVLYRFYRPEIAREIMRRMRSSEHGPEGKLLTTPVTFVRKDGRQIPLSLSASLIMEGGKEIGSVGIFSDLSEMFRMRRELEEARNQLFQAEKIASLGRLSAGVAHEINNPLAGILIYADLLMREIGDNPHWRRDLDEIINQTLRCKQIVNRLLEFSRQPLGQRVAYDTNDIVQRCLELLGHQTLFHDIEFYTDFQHDLPAIVGDPSQMQQVFTNLVINAASAMEGKGQIRISSRYNKVADNVVLTFSDTGPGVPDEIKDKIFEPFFTTKRPREGTGLGLSVAYGIIQQHGGSIEVGDAPGGGALFIVTLPLESPESQFELIED